MCHHCWPGCTFGKQCLRFHLLLCVLPHTWRRCLWSRTPDRTPRPIASSQKPVYDAANWQPPPKSADHLHAQKRSRDETIVSDPGRLVSRLRRKFFLRIFATHPIFLPLLAEISLQPTILHYPPVFALANYVAWCHQRTIENTTWFNKKHTQYWTVSLLDRFHPKWQQFGWLPFQSVPTLYCRDWPAFTIQFVIR